MHGPLCIYSLDLKNDTMTNRLTVILCMLLLCQLGLSAQDNDDIPYRHEWRFGLAGLPIMDGLLYSDGYFDIDPHINYLDPDRLYKDYNGTSRMFGLISAEYSINFRKRFTFAVGGYLTSAWNRVYRYDGTPKRPEIGFGLTIMPTARFKYVSRDAFSMYGSAGLGVMVGLSEKEVYCYPTFQLVPLGLTFGRKVYGFAEFGLGTLYIGGNIGVGYRF